MSWLEQIFVGIRRKMLRSLLVLFWRTCRIGGSMDTLRFHLQYYWVVESGLEWFTNYIKLIIGFFAVTLIIMTVIRSLIYVYAGGHPLWSCLLSCMICRRNSSMKYLTHPRRWFQIIACNCNNCNINLFKVFNSIKAFFTVRCRRADSWL